jgi:hypothetical protein
MALAAVMDTRRSLPIMDDTHPASDDALLAAPDRGTARWWERVAAVGTPFVARIAPALVRVTFLWREAGETTDRVYIDVNGVTDHHAASPQGLTRIRGERCLVAAGRSARGLARQLQLHPRDRGGSSAAGGNGRDGAAGAPDLVEPSRARCHVRSMQSACGLSRGLGRVEFAAAPARRA